MTDHDRLQAAVAELYSSDPDKFVERRKALAAEARSAREDAAASRIAALRKPTRSAWVINQLARSDPAATAELVRLGDELGAAQRALNGARIRELSVRRRELIDALTRQALGICGEHPPSAALRDEVTGTLGAALADPQIAEQVQDGTLLRAARSEGFGPMAPVLTVVPPPPPGAARTSQPRTSQPRTAQSRPSQSRTVPSRTGPARAGLAPETWPRPARGKAAAQSRSRAAAQPDAHRPAAQPDAHRTAVAAAEKALAEAHRIADLAIAAEEQQRIAVEKITEQLADARGRFNAARIEARRADAGLRQARLALERLRRQGGSGLRSAD